MNQRSGKEVRLTIINRGFNFYLFDSNYLVFFFFFSTSKEHLNNCKSQLPSIHFQSPQSWFLKMIEFNYQDEVVFSPTVIVTGRTDSDQGIIQFTNNDNKVFPMLTFEVNNHWFKALLNLSPDEANHFKVEFWRGARVLPNGVPDGKKYLSDEGELTLRYITMPGNKPVHMCVIVGKDSKGEYDMPKYKLDRGEKANLETAVQRLKVAGRMMQAFTQEEFKRTELSNRTFPFVEESTRAQTLFGVDKKAAVAHNEIKVHVLRSPKTMAELRDPDYAQQNPNAKNRSWLFSHALEIIGASDIIKPYKRNNTPIQCAVMYLDTKWDGSLITAHAAVGGGSGEVELAIFGSHGLHSFPLTFPLITPSFSDDTVLSITEVANDLNQCGTPWECMNICMGAFMHEIGHMFGSPHEVSGVMLRDYIWWNRLFMTREFRCLRDNNAGQLIGREGKFPRECHWHILDIIRFLYHGSFSIPSDLNDDSFTKKTSTLMKPGETKPVPSFYPTTPGLAVIKSTSPIYLVELVSDDLARHHLQFLPKSYGGPGTSLEVKLNFEDYLNEIHNAGLSSAQDLDLRILSTSGETWIAGLKSRCYPSEEVIESDFNLGKGTINGLKSELLGSENGTMEYVGFDVTRVYKVRIFHGGALDGMTFYYRSDKSEAENEVTPKFSKRKLLTKLLRNAAIGDMKGSDSPAGEVTIGNTTSEFTDFLIPDGEQISKFSFRCGVWIDGVQIETDKSRSSGMLGNAKGGHLAVLEPPSIKFTIIGLYGYTGQWLNGIGIIYASV